MNAKGNQSVLGLKFGNRSVRFVDLCHLDDGYQLISCGEGELFQDLNIEGLMNLGERYKMADAITSVLESHQVETRSVVTSIDTQLAIVKRVPLEEQLRGEELRDYIQWQAGQYIIAPLDEYVVDFQHVDPEEREAILVAARRAVVNSYAEVLEAAGLIPIVVDVDCFAIYNALEFNYYSWGEGAVAVVNVEPHLNDIVILRSGKFWLQESFGRQHVVDQAGSTSSPSSSSSEVSFELSCAVISRKLREALSALEAEGGKGVYNKIFLSGSEALDSRLAQYLSFQHGSPVETVDPFLKVRVDPALVGREGFSKEAPKYLICLGLAIRKGAQE